MYIFDSVSETSVSGEVIDIVNSVHNVILVGIKLHVIIVKRNCGCAPGFHVDVVAQLLSTETMTKTIMSPFPYMVKYLFIHMKDKL